MKTKKQSTIDLFWKNESVIIVNDKILLREVQECDKSDFIKIEYENTLMPAFFKYQMFVDELWNEHISDVVLNCSIIHRDTNEYIGYCGIKNIYKERWEVVIELLNKWTNKGIGYYTLKKFFDRITHNIGILEFRVRIDSVNYASQKMFEKLGAIPNGISKFLLQDEEIICECEEENKQLIDDDLIKVAEKFQVEPRKLLSHVLEYKIVWKKEVNK